VEVEAEETRGIEVAEEEAGVVHMDRSSRRNLERRTSSISPSIRTSRFRSSLMAAGKVCC